MAVLGSRVGVDVDNFRRHAIEHRVEGFRVKGFVVDEPLGYLIDFRTVLHDQFASRAMGPRDDLTDFLVNRQRGGV